MKRRVVLLGPPGSGKGTLAKMLETKHQLQHISSGQWFRKEMESGSRFGLLVKDHIDKGQLVPDSEVIRLIQHWITPELLSDGFLLDGFPRTITQALELDKFCAEFKTPIEAALFCDCPEEVLINRATGRRICLTCGAGYHVRNWPPLKDGVCDKCGSALSKRDDDQVEVVKERLQVYSESTLPLVEYYEKANKLTRLDANQPLKDLLGPAEKALGV
ncbi:MAG: adenylate kinase family protein [Verrucomicrobiales bacterium]